MNDKISAKLEEIIMSVEDKLWLNESNDIGLVYAQADLRPVLSHVREKSSNIPAIERVSIMKSIETLIEPLYRITSIVQFKSANRLNYSDYANMPAVRDVLLMYTVETSISQKAVSACNIIATVLSDIDSTRPHYKNSLSYKYLRAFILLVLVGDYISASCIATFILTQLGE